MANTVVILGARGRFGLAAAMAFANAGWSVVAHKRPGSSVPWQVSSDSRITWVALDLQDTQGWAKAAQGACVVVHAINPVYTDGEWRRQALPLLESGITLARTLQATLMLPGNVYNFGSSMPAQLTEETRQLADTVKGRIRMDMEARLQASGIHSVVIRAGDFFGCGTGSWFDQVMAKELRKGVLTYPGERDTPTAWAYLPDLAKCFVAVAERRAELPNFDVLHFAGHTLTGQDWLDALSKIALDQGWIATGTGVGWRSLPWPLLKLMGYFNPVYASLYEMRYLWRRPHALVNAKLVRLLGAEPHTPLQVALPRVLQDLGLAKASQDEACSHPSHREGYEGV